MTKKKYYAVRSGLKTGIFETWDECKQLVIGVKGAEYKSFSSLEDAKAYMNHDVPEDGNCLITDDSEINPDYISDYTSKLDGETAVAFTDGSFDKASFKYSYGCVYLTNSGSKTFSGVGDDERFSKSHNVAGELLGVLFIVDYAIKDGKTKITIHHDYAGISKFADGSFTANTPISQYYVSQMDIYKQLIDISFVKVAGHTGVPLNEVADKIARKALTEK